MKALCISACLLSLSLGLARAATDKPAFEVATIKPSDPNGSNPMWVGMSADRAMVTWTNITLRDCIRAAYRMRDFQITGPPWIDSSRFEIAAKLAPGASLDQIPEMLQALLAERFGLTIEHETKEQTVYALLVRPDGPKLKPPVTGTTAQAPTALGPDGKPRQAMMFQFSPSGVTLNSPSANLASLVELMSRFTELPVVDRTGVEGQYEFTLDFAPETTRGLPPSAIPGTDDAPEVSEHAPSLSEALREYGLRLEVQKAPLEMLTITHLEKTPTQN